MRMTLLALAMAAAWPAVAATVYKTVDAAGKVSFSDTPPAAGASADVIELPESRTAPDPATAERLQQMRDTTERLREDRLARERERALQYPPAAPAYAAPAPDDADYDDSRWLVPYYPPYRRWHGGDHHPRPPYRPPGPPSHAQPEPPPSGSAAHSPRGLTQRLREAR